MIVRNLRLGVRLLTRHRMFAVAALSVLALGIGATTAVFTVVRSVLLEPLPYPEPQNLMSISADAPGVGRVPALTPDEFAVLKDSGLFSAVATINPAEAHLTDTGNMEVVSSASMSDNFLSVLGLVPALGRQASVREDVLNQAVQGVNVSYELWRRRWHSDPAIVGRSIEINNRQMTVVGVMPEGFRLFLGPAMNLPDRVDVWFPAAPDDSRARSIPVIARLAPGTSLASAQSRLDAILGRHIADHPGSYASGPVRVSLAPLEEAVVGEVRPALVALAGAVAFVLLVASTNLTNLLLARGTARIRELAVRTAIGASRRQLIVQLMCESLVLAAVGAVLGLLVAEWGISGLLRLAPASLPRRSTIAIDLPMAAFAMAASIACSLVFGLLPAWLTTRSDVSDMLKQSLLPPARTRLAQGLLISSQVALSLALLTGAALMSRTFVNLRHVPLGFDDTHVLTMKVNLNARAFNTMDKRRAFFSAAAASVRQLPGVKSAGLGLPVPLDGQPFVQRFSTTDDPTDRVAWSLVALPGYLETLAVPLRQGRYFSATDDEAEFARVIVDERLADTLWPGRAAVGQRLLLGASTASVRPAVEVIGVAAHVRTEEPRRETGAQLWLPYRSRALSSLGIAIRSAGDPALLTASIKTAIENLGPGRPVSDARLLSSYTALATSGTRFAVFVLTVFAGVALLLTLSGIFGVVAYTTALREREIAVRVALGSSAGHILGTVLRPACLWIGLGVMAGTAAALGLSRFVETLLYGVAPRDPLTLLLTGAITCLAAALAAAWPAVRAARVDPIRALRSE